MLRRFWQSIQRFFRRLLGISSRTPPQTSPPTGTQQNSFSPDTLAKSDSTFNEYYQKNRQTLLNPAAVQKQGPRPTVNEAAENRAQEIENISVELNDNELLEIAQKVLIAPDPVKAAQEIQQIPYMLP